MRGLITLISMLLHRCRVEEEEKGKKKRNAVQVRNTACMSPPTHPGHLSAVPIGVPKMQSGKTEHKIPLLHSRALTECRCKLGCSSSPKNCNTI